MRDGVPRKGLSRNVFHAGRVEAIPPFHQTLSFRKFIKVMTTRVIPDTEGGAPSTAKFHPDVLTLTASTITSSPADM